MAAVKTLNQKRGQVKAGITRFEAFVNNCSPEEMLQLPVRLERIKASYDKFENIQEEIEELLLTGEVTPQNRQVLELEFETERNAFERSYFRVVALAQNKIDEHNQANRALADEVDVRERGGFSRDNATGNQMQVKLPILNLPTFNGEYDKWLFFKDSFQSLIVENQQLNDIQKFQYLRSSLKGEPLHSIQALQASAENYQIAWNLLKERYENKKLIINTHIKELLEFPTVSKESHGALRAFIDHIRSHSRALATLEQPVDHWDTLLLFLSTRQLDHQTRCEWEFYVGKELGQEMPSMDNFLDFLSRRCHTLEMTENIISKSEKSLVQKRIHDKKVSLATTTIESCSYCSGEHQIYRCKDFLELPIDKRIVEAKTKQICINCLRKGHFVKDCTSSTCRKCSKKHNTLLHIEGVVRKSQSVSSQNPTTSNSHSAESNSSAIVTHVQRQISQVILSTAQVIVFDADGKPYICKALLDQGSQSHLITKSLMTKLRIPCSRIHLPISGVDSTSTSVTESARIRIKSMHNGFTSRLDCCVLRTITSKLPQVKVNLQMPNDLHLADPTYDVPSEIDLLIGAELFWNLLCVGRIPLGENQPILQKTVLGWVVGGKLVESIEPKSVSCLLSTTSSLDKQLEKCWQIEEVDCKIPQSKLEADCERYFQETTRRNSEGRFVVSLPQDKTVILGQSSEAALQRFYSLERRFKRQPELKKSYAAFLDEYEAMGHMKAVPEEEALDKEGNYYLPHQAIIKSESLSTKLRVVFDGSAKTSNGVSLNDRLLVGPNIQNDLIDIIIRFRSHNYVITADIEKMYRQIDVAEDDTNLQRIFWRKELDQPIRVYRLNTVTYGTSCAPFLAIRCLRQLAQDERQEFPLETSILERDFYMDDVLTGANSLKEAIDCQSNLSSLLKRGGFILRKWRTNDERILEKLSKDDKSSSLMVIDKQEAIATLGVLWNANTDTLQYKVVVSENYKITKRNILARVAQIYDPLGLIGPVLIVAKLIMQQLWQSQISWDEQVTKSIDDQWSSYYNSLLKLNELRIPRQINPGTHQGDIELHGFGDASEKAYGACIYAVTQDSFGSTTSRLICSKSRVAPLKTVSLPRLELNAALLLTRLALVVQKSLKEKITEIHLWSDSTIALAWIRKSTSHLETYVANRVAEIQRSTSSDQWKHVSSTDNPADLISRGIPVQSLQNNELWWSGPKWILSREEWPLQILKTPNEIPGLKKNVLLVALSPVNEMLKKYSNYDKLERVVAYCHRALTNRKGKRTIGSPTVEERRKSATSIVRMIQEERFKQKLQDLRKNKVVDNKSSLLNLKPFLDDNGLIRVGGRLENADLSVDQRHPIVLPAKHSVTTLIMKKEHERLMHCGTEQLLCSLRHRYWPLSGRREARKITRSCIQCFRYKPRLSNTEMADLPKSRVEGFNRPFYYCGVDYAGPLEMRASKGRGRVPVFKIYIAVFTCFSTKAVHLELVTSLSTEAFLAAFRRFAARRGTCAHMYSDNGTNFVGAARELCEVYHFLQQNNDEIHSKLAARKVTWHFIPPRSPHFGGLWEAAVKSVKRHLKIITQGQKYVYEEYYTLLVEIEAILNSRPLTSISSDPNDLMALTPAHFLVGESLVEPPQYQYSDVPDNRLSAWQHLQKLRQHFWKRWKREYLHQLQTRSKWYKGDKNLEVGRLVLLIDENSSSLNWPLARVLAVHPGDDGIVRVVTVKSTSGTFKRAVRKVCALPLDIEKND